jgi:hypothetical protein
MLKIIEKVTKGLLKGYLFVFTAPFVILFILFVFSLDATFTIVRKRK